MKILVQKVHDIKKEIIKNNTQKHRYNKKLIPPKFKCRKNYGD